jgi:hypothetical protein
MFLITGADCLSGALILEGLLCCLFMDCLSIEGALLCVSSVGALILCGE